MSMNLRAGGEVKEFVVQAVRNARADASAFSLVPNVNTRTA